MVKLAALVAAGVILAIIVGALIVFPLLHVGGFKVFRRRF
jgi:hypothetical protein